MGLGACMKPVDVQPFLGSNTVQEIIESTKAKVKVDDKTGDGLIGRDGKIEGLKNDKYYMVEKELDDKGAPVEDDYPKYVTDKYGSGKLYDKLSFITRISDGSINGLINFHTYTVRAAEPLPNGSLSYTDDNGTVTKQIIDGAVDIGGIKGTGRLDLSGVITGIYEVIAVSADSSPNPWKDSKKLSLWKAFELEGADTEVDYVFVKTSDPSDFKVLRVKIGPTIQAGIKITLTFTVTDKTTVSPGSGNIVIGTLDGSSKATLTLNVSGGGTPGNIKWYYNNDLSTVIGSAATLILSNNTTGKDYLVVGEHIFTVVAEINGAPYSASFRLTVTEK